MSKIFNFFITSRTLFLLLSFFLLLFLKTDYAFAAIGGTPINGSPPPDYVQCAQPSECSPQICYNGPSVGDPAGCGEGCNFSGNTWTKYQCLGGYEDPDNAGALCQAYYNDYGAVCSTGDKCVAGETGLRSGSCDCGSYSPTVYKYCCSVTGAPEACTVAGTQDNEAPPEGQCPGGYIVDGSRVRDSSCFPLCNQNTCTPGTRWCNADGTSQSCVEVQQPNPACNPSTYWTAGTAQICKSDETCNSSTGTCAKKTCTVDILANPQGISRGEETRLAWFSSNAASCSIPGIGTVPVSGERTVRPNQTTTYSITCSPAAGTSCSDNVRVTVSSGGGVGPCPGGECTAGQANTKQCAGSASYQTCQLDPTRGRYCWTAQSCPNGQTCTGAGTCGCPASNPFSCNNQCWTNPCPYGISCTPSGAVCNPTPTPTPTTPIPTPTPTPTPPPSCGPVVLGPDCLNPCTGARTCNYSNRFLYYACTGDAVCLTPELDDTCIGQANNCAPTSISGSVFLDTNQDGTKQPAEALYGGGTNVTAEFSPGPYAPGYCSGWAGSYNSCMRDYMQICDEFGGQERTRCIAEAEGYCGPCKYPPRPTGAPSTPPPPTVTSIGPGQYKVTSPTAGADLPTGTYTVTYQPPGTYQTTEPPSGNSFTVIVGPGCSPGASKNASCFGGSVNNLHFGLLASNPWLQSTGADLRIDSGFSADIPANAACGAYASLPGAGGSPGVIYSGTRGSSFGGGQASQTNWTAGGATYPESYTPTRPNLIRTSYSYLLSVAKQAAITPINILSYCGPGGLNSCTLPASLPNGLYIANGNLTLAGGTYTFPVNKNFVILVGGDLNIRQRILVPNGSTATFSSAGDITVERSVGQAVNSSTAPDVEGFYSADKNFIADGVNNCGAGADLRLNIAGAVVVNAALGGGSFQNNRDLCEGNAQCPAFAVSERPDFVLNAPEFIKHPSFIWQESAP